MMLARQGHSVTVLEHDSVPLPGSPEEAWNAWERRGVAQFRQPHFLHTPVRQLLDAHLPDVKEGLLRAGCITFDRLSTMPQSITDRMPREGDERFVTITGRRPAIEYAFASAAERLMPVCRGASVVGLLTRPSAVKGIPHVIGVRTIGGEEVSADLIIDAMGRTSKLPNWLEAVGARRPIEEAEDSGFIYYTRYLRSKDRGDSGLSRGGTDIFPFVCARHAPRRRGHLVGDCVHLLGRSGAEEAPLFQVLDGSGRRMSIARTLARR